MSDHYIDRLEPYLIRRDFEGVLELMRDGSLAAGLADDEKADFIGLRSSTRYALAADRSLGSTNDPEMTLALWDKRMAFRLHATHFRFLDLARFALYEVRRPRLARVYMSNHMNQRGTVADFLRAVTDCLLFEDAPKPHIPPVPTIAYDLAMLYHCYHDHQRVRALFE